MNEERAKIAIGVLIFAGLLGLWTLAAAGDLEPSGPPAPTMKTLNEVYDSVVEGSSGISKREGYWADVEVGSAGNHDFFTVQAGKQFVLLRVTITGDSTSVGYWDVYLTDGNFSMGSRYMRYYVDPVYYYGFCYEDFPDRTVTVNAGDTLSIVNNDSYARRVRIVGYFFDI